MAMGGARLEGWGNLDNTVCGEVVYINARNDVTQVCLGRNIEDITDSFTLNASFQG